LGDIHRINNYQRESSVYLKTDETKDALPFPSDTTNISGGISDNSSFTLSEVGNCDKVAKEENRNVISYYASIKNQIDDQWGQLYSYETVDTGYQVIFDEYTPPNIFGGDTFICRFAYKTKLPFFIDNRVKAPDDSDIYYDEIGNVGYPTYWHSARSITKDYTIGNSPGYVLSNFISYKAHNFDCPSIIQDEVTTTTTTTSFVQLSETDADDLYYDGKFYLFAYGVPSFYCESSYNVDLRQAFNNKEGDFFPHVTDAMPDEWVQESNVSIANDNTYYYNTTFSKQNKENTFTHLPVDWDSACHTHYPFRAIYSDAQNTDSDNIINSWLTYRAVSYFDFPQNLGNLTSLDGIQNKAILARFHNKSLLYNNLLTIDTSNPQAAYIGNPKLFSGAPPIDFAETDLGYVGSQHKFLLKIPEGQITIDAKRGQIFLIQGTQVRDISGPGSGMNRFLTDNLNFNILKWFPDFPIDNHYKDIGLHGVYDAKYDRIIITKLDYSIINDNISYDDGKFYLTEIIGEEEITREVHLSDTEYFCNRSWTLSYSFITNSWIAFHSYLPNWYIGETGFFYSGLNDCCDDFDFIVGIPEDESECSLRGATAFIVEFPRPDCYLSAVIDWNVPDCGNLEGIAQIVNCFFEGVAYTYDMLDCSLEGKASTIIPSTECTWNGGIACIVGDYACNMKGEAVTLVAEITTTTTTTMAEEGIHHMKMCVNDTTYDFGNEINIPYLDENIINTPTKSGYNYLFLSIPTDRSFVIHDSLNTDVTSEFSIDINSGVGGVDVRAGYHDNYIYRSHDVFATDYSIEYTITLL